MSLRHFFRSKSPLVFLPYQRNSSDFCMQCLGECVDVCAEGIIIKKDEAVPYLDFATNGCVFCKKCAQICEATYGENSVLDPSLEDKINARAKIDVIGCLAYHQVICSACKDICDGAIRFSGMFYPEILESCTGCGKCERVCPKDAINIVAL
ncbi:4Fe-4S binding protein [Helicobacter sp. 11S02596-1]|uniref:4Fe-4S binding protein n=1 Tax=Helicobacter sp. 11S02596-1 TaxID=1476194 RepID=UPI000BA6104D|nr:4Fe-4S binding protein [Helicobacter sp. 11S02596-1]PAF44433.1 hypothetical protein BJI48_02600 [Helicobacter sp. 11S02596-1]